MSIPKEHFFDNALMWRCFANHPNKLLSLETIQKITHLMRGNGWHFKKMDQNSNYAALTFAGGLKESDERNYALSETAYELFRVSESLGLKITVHNAQLISDWMDQTGYGFENIKTKERLCTTVGSANYYWFQEQKDKGCLKEIKPALRSMMRSHGLQSLILH